MTTFAIFYEKSDLSAIAGTVQSLGLSNTLKNQGRPYWNGGLKNWDTAPFGVSPTDDPASCPNCVRVVMSGTGTLAGFIQLLRDIATFWTAQGNPTSATDYMTAIANGLSSPPIGNNSSGVEPWTGPIP